MSARLTAEERLRLTPLPDPPPDLRGRVLAAAEGRLRRDVTWADRMWFSWRWRAAGAALVVALVAVDWIPIAPSPRTRAEPSLFAADTARAVDETARGVGLSAPDADRLVRRALQAAAEQAARNASFDELIGERR